MFSFRPSKMRFRLEEVLQTSDQMEIRRYSRRGQDTAELAPAALS